MTESPQVLYGLVVFLILYGFVMTVLASFAIKRNAGLIMFGIAAIILIISILTTEAMFPSMQVEAMLR